MTITLTHPTAGAGGTPLPLSLPPSLLWVDQYGWKSVEQAKRYTSTGSLHVDNWVKQSGQPMTLQGTQNRAWCARGDLNTLRVWAAQDSLQLAINHRGAAYTVVFDHEQQAIEAEPLSELLQGGSSRYTVRNEANQIVLDVDVDYFNPQDTDPFAVTVRFLIL